MFTLGFRGADEMWDLMEPLVLPPGSVSSVYNQLVVKTTSTNMEDNRRVQATVDPPPANLIISVKHVGNAEVLTGW